MEPYRNTGPVDCNIDFDTSNIRGKTAIITGGSNGIGEGYTRTLVKSGAFVVIGDINEKAGLALEAELKGSAKFVRCDVTKWEDQVTLFTEALKVSPTKRIDIVAANAGISGPDPVFITDDSQEVPEKPDLKILEIDLIGVLYTVKLALHHLRRQHAADPGKKRDALILLQGSLAGYLHLPGSLQYGAAKMGLRSMLQNMRLTEWKSGIRVNYIGPWYIATKIMTSEQVEKMKSRGLKFASLESVTECFSRIASDTRINGRSFAIVPSDISPRGYIDINDDDHRDGFIKDLQVIMETSTFRADIM